MRRFAIFFTLSLATGAFHAQSAQAQIGMGPGGSFGSFGSFGGSSGGSSGGLFGGRFAGGRLFGSSGGFGSFGSGGSFGSVGGSFGSFGSAGSSGGSAGGLFGRRLIGGRLFGSSGGFGSFGSGGSFGGSVGGFAPHHADASMNFGGGFVGGHGHAGGHGGQWIDYPHYQTQGTPTWAPVHAPGGVPVGAPMYTPAPPGSVIPTPSTFPMDGGLIPSSPAPMPAPAGVVPAPAGNPGVPSPAAMKESRVTRTGATVSRSYQLPASVRSLKPMSARLTLRVPSDATVYVDGDEISGNGPTRTLAPSEELEPDVPYVYRVKVEIERNKVVVSKTAVVSLIAGKVTDVKFDFSEVEPERLSIDLDAK
jgi:uncharacterized protein (TIGR03000 family)